MKRQRRFGRVMLVLVGVLVIGLTPMLSSAICLQDSLGAVYNYNVDPVSGDVAGVQGVVGVAHDLSRGCPPSAFSGSLVQKPSEMTFELGASFYSNATTCIPQLTLAATVDANTLAGHGVILTFHRDGTFMAREVTVGPCGATSTTIETDEGSLRQQQPAE